MNALLNKRTSLIPVLAKWICAAAVSLLLIATLYALFLGRYTFVRNESIYRGHHFVGKSGTVHLFSNEGYGVTSFGKDGLVVNKEIRDDLPRILFLGDSFVEANHVSDEYKFTEVVEKEWNSRYADRPIQTLNLGLSALDIRTYLQFAQDIDAQFAPNLVLILLDQNDFRTVSRNPDMLTDIATGQVNGLIRPGREPVGNQLLYNLGIKSFAVRLALQTRAFTGNKKLDAPTAIDEATLRDAYSVQLSALKRAWGERLIIIHHEHVNNFGRTPSVRTNSLLGEVIREEEIPVIALYDALYAATQAQKSPYGFSNSILGQGHFNKGGHEIVANQVLNYLESVSDIFEF